VKGPIHRPAAVRSGVMPTAGLSDLIEAVPVNLSCQKPWDVPYWTPGQMACSSRVYPPRKVRVAITEHLGSLGRAAVFIWLG